MLNPAQIIQILESLEVPACLCNSDNEALAKNALADEIVPASRWDEAERKALGDGWTLLLLRRSAEQAPAPVPIENIGALANGMAHALRNPLSSIITAASLVNDDPNTSEETVMLLGIITKESKHLNQILTDFLNYVRPRPSQVSRFDIGEALRGTVKVLKVEGILGPKVVIEDQISEALWTEGDETQLRQALWSIVRNAAEMMPGGGTLSLSGHLDGGRIYLAIEDSGRGFSEKELVRAFEPFFSNTTEGTGLGLTVARSSLAAFGGRIWIENKTAPATGARMCLELPESSSNA